MIVTGYGQAAETDFVLFSRNLLRSTSRVAYVCHLYLLSILMEPLKKQVTCSICFDTYTEPKTISCLHTFCCECLEKHVRVSQKKGKFRCPECQAVIDLPDGNRFDHLPNSFFHKSSLNRAVRQVGAASIALLVINAA